MEPGARGVRFRDAVRLDDGRRRVRAFAGRVMRGSVSARHQPSPRGVVLTLAWTLSAISDAAVVALLGPCGWRAGRAEIALSVLSMLRAWPAVAERAPSIVGHRSRRGAATAATPGSVVFVVFLAVGRRYHRIGSRDDAGSNDGDGARRLPSSGSIRASRSRSRCSSWR